jgi:hypothetical protein
MHTVYSARVRARVRPSDHALVHSAHALFPTTHTRPASPPPIHSVRVREWTAIVQY